MESIWILRHIYLDKYFLFFLIIIILTGNFNYFIPYFLLLFFHEISHAVTGIILGYKLERIIFYPLGGVTIINYPVNIPLFSELLIVIAGPLMQILVYLILKEYYPFIKLYHYTLLVFNLLPIYPLDGGKILSIICGYYYSFIKSFNITFIISVIMVFFLTIYAVTNFNLNLVLMIILIISKLINLYRNKFIIYEHFLLERYLYQYNFHKIKNISSIREFHRDHNHIINFVKEKDYLNKYFHK